MQSNIEVRTQICEVLKRFSEFVSTKNPQVLAEFAPSEGVILIGSESGVIARGSQELNSFFTQIFTGDSTFSWEWDRIDVSYAGNLAWIFAEGRIVLTTAKEQQKSPFRMSGVLERQGERWLWRQFHGSEPVQTGIS